MSYEKIGRKENLPVKIVRILTDSILSGELSPGDVMPPEPILAEQFGVSRTVVRDAVKMLIAKGLLNIVHGKGTYVSSSQTVAFTESLNLALIRNKATAWDIEEFYKILFPKLFSLAATKADKSDKENIRKAADNYISYFTNYVYSDIQKNEPSEELLNTYHTFMHTLFRATGNKVVELMGDVFLNIRQLHKLETDSDSSDNQLLDDETKKTVIRMETEFIDNLAKAVISGDYAKAAKIYSASMDFNEETIEKMKKTPIGISPTVSLNMFE